MMAQVFEIGPSVRVFSDPTSAAIAIQHFARNAGSISNLAPSPRIRERSERVLVLLST